MIFWLYYTTTYLEKKQNTKPLSCGKKRSVFCRESCHLKKKKSPFYSWDRSFANLRNAWLLQKEFPDLGFLVWTITIKVWQNTEPTEPNYWFSSAVYSIKLRPILSIKRRKAIMGLRWSNWLLKTLLFLCKTAISYKKTPHAWELNMRSLMLFLFQVQIKLLKI